MKQTRITEQPTCALPLWKTQCEQCFLTEEQQSPPHANPNFLHLQIYFPETQLNTVLVCQNHVFFWKLIRNSFSIISSAKRDARLAKEMKNPIITVIKLPVESDAKVLKFQMR